MPINLPNNREFQSSDVRYFDETSENEIVEFFEKLLHYFGLVDHCDPMGHKVGEAGKNLFKFFIGLFGNSDPDDFSYLSISEIHSTLQVNDIQLSAATQNRPVAAAFLLFMLENNLLNIRFERAITHSQFKNFLNAIWSSTPTDDLSEILAEANVAMASVQRQVSYEECRENTPKISIYDYDATPIPMPAENKAESDILDAKESGEIGFADEPAITDDENGVRIRRLIVKVSVGDHPLVNANVLVDDGVSPMNKSTDIDGAVIELTPGEYNVQITYEQFKIDRVVTIPYDDKETVMNVDFQSIFEF